MIDYNDVQQILDDDKAKAWELRELAASLLNELVDVQNALVDYLDGVSDHDIQGNTGLPAVRCAQIAEVRKDAIRTLGDAK